MARQYAFKSSSRFSRAFHEEYGMTPEKYYKEEFRNEEWIRYIDEHMKEELTAEQLAKEFHYSKDHFRKEFQDVFECNRSLISHSEKYSLLQKHSEKENYRRKLEKNMGSVRETGLTKHFAECFIQVRRNTPEQEQRLSIWTAIILNIKIKSKFHI